MHRLLVTLVSRLPPGSVNVLSLFSGVGGLELGLERAGLGGAAS